MATEYKTGHLSKITFRKMSLIATKLLNEF